MIAISVLQDAQRQIHERTNARRKIRCFFSESNPEAFAQLNAAVAAYNQPQDDFELRTYCGRFEDAIPSIQNFIGNSFPLIFIDPTGWTGYSFDKIKLLFARKKCEVLINFMYDFINRFSYSDDQEIIDSLAPILGGPDWPDRLDKDLPRGKAVERLFRESLKRAGNFDFVVSTRIDKSTVDRPHFFIAYGTKNEKGLITFRQTEYIALRAHAKDRAHAADRKREEKSNTRNMFAAYDAELQEAEIDEIVADQKKFASQRLLSVLTQFGPQTFSKIVSGTLQAYMLRETNVKDICVELAKLGKIENTWGGGSRKPRNHDVIRIKA